jgi:KUP system potassium uptake protein
MATAAIVSPQPTVATPAIGALAVGALGVVYGDIGTSPLYTLKTALEWGGGAVPDVALGMLSLIVWTLLITTSVKYVALVMRADNDGEGGILALMSLLGLRQRERTGVIALGLLGAALLYGDGAITPAISVLSALEGLKQPLPAITPYVLPLVVVILVGLFALQRQGTARIGRMFGPVMILWFISIGLLGLVGVLAHPGVLWALDPRCGLGYLFGHGMRGFTVLGAVFLCATGAEALYADMGQFGRQPIRLGWYGLVLPTLVLSYAGQTALVVDGAIGPGDNPFFALSTTGMRLPLVALATVATIIASQSIISGVFSMTRQAIQIGLCPRLNVTQTSAEGYGQIYVGSVNWILMAFTLLLAISFGSSDNLAAAFGIAVSLTMLLTSALLFLAMRDVWGWGLLPSAGVAGLLMAVDLSFVSANLMKLLQGGWVPLVAAAAIFFLMSTWRTGRAALLSKLERDTMPLTSFLSQMEKTHRVPGTAVYMTRRLDVVPVPMLHNLKHYKVLHKRNVIVHVMTEHVPRVAAHQRVEVTALGGEVYSIVMHYGFMQHPNVPRALEACKEVMHGLEFDLMQTSFFLARESIGAASPSALNSLQRQLFIAMHRNAQDATAFFRIPPNRMVELGSRIEI